MKKIYMEPTTVVVKIKATQIFAMSKVDEPTQATSGNLSRRGDIDFDFEDFDEEY